MKKLALIVSIISLLVSFAALPTSAYAANPLDAACKKLNATQKQESTSCNDSVDGNKNPLVGPDGIINKITNVIALLAGSIAVIMIIVLAIGMVTSGGDSQRFAHQRNGIIFAAVGLVVIVVARSLITFVVNRL